MNVTTSEKLYNLLPSIYRMRDIKQGEPLRALMSVIENELQLMERDIEGLYDNWFIETCEEWVVPYIGNLLGVRGLHPGSSGTFSIRSFVANTLAYRRRKGTAVMLEQLARDVTGWNARAVEYFKLVRSSQHMNHVRLNNLSNPDLRNLNTLQLLDTPFDTIPHTADIRQIGKSRGKHNIMNVGLFMWRLSSYFLKKTTAWRVNNSNGNQFTFSSLGSDIPLFNRPQTETDISHLAGEVNVPGKLRSYSLYKELEDLRQSIADDREFRPVYFGEHPVFEIFLNGSTDPISFENILIAEIAEGYIPPESKDYLIPGDEQKVKTFDIDVAIDPVRGRIAFPAKSVPNKVQVSYAYGFSADIGGGAYDHEEVTSGNSVEVWRISVSQDNSHDASNLDEAIKEWQKYIDNAIEDRQKSIIERKVIITFKDSGTYNVDTEQTSISLKPDQELVIQAANGCRPLLRLLDSDGNISTLNIEISETDENDESRTAASLTINGLLIEGGLKIAENSLAKLEIIHTTLVPSTLPSIIVKAENRNFELDITHSIIGSLKLSERMRSLTVRDGIIDASGSEDDSNNNKAIGGYDDGVGPSTTLERVTVFGEVRVSSMNLATEVIFNNLVTVTRRQEGCIRYSYLPIESLSPKKFRCQPELALATEKYSNTDFLRPGFVSSRYGEPEYGQLSRDCAQEIKTGGEDNREMGAFNYIMQPQREANLKASMDDYLRFGMEAGIFYVT
ncbi:MAG: hypothetical protein IIB94_01230 [Candidatus Marinimicrobia bacterium]|nr:hypothetical protein [Candidatus Neomarinimicrobiota bacterium]